MLVRKSWAAARVQAVFRGLRARREVAQQRESLRQQALRRLEHLLRRAVVWRRFKKMLLEKRQVGHQGSEFMFNVYFVFEPRAVHPGCVRPPLASKLASAACNVGRSSVPILQPLGPCLG